MGQHLAGNCTKPWPIPGLLGPLCRVSQQELAKQCCDSCNEKTQMKVLPMKAKPKTKELTADISYDYVAKILHP